MRDGETIYAVGRSTFGCCGDDGFAGFIIEYDGVVPEEDEWIGIVGTLAVRNTQQGQQYPVVVVDELTVKQERGLEFVTR